MLPFAAMSRSRQAAPVIRTSAARPGPLGLLAAAARDVWSRRRLTGYLVSADLKKKGRDTLFGNIWWVLDPLLQMAVYVVLLTIIFERKEKDYPLFLFAAILPWKWFSTAVGDAITSVSGQDKVIKQVQFPKIVLPVAATLSTVTQFAFGMIPLSALLILLYRQHITPWLLLIPVVALVQLVFTMAFCLVVSAVNVFFRDVANLSHHALRMWFYLSPALYGAAVIDKIAGSHHIIASLIRINPFYPILNAYRSLIYEGASPDWASLGAVLGASTVFLLLATWFFKRTEPMFAKVL
jgi:ABC-type polysaccharide/polyol phosphate export permease